MLTAACNDHRQRPPAGTLPMEMRNRGTEAVRFFDTTGPVRPADHHCIPPLGRFDLDEAPALVRMKKCIVLHAPRRTGKTVGPA